MEKKRWRAASGLFEIIKVEEWKHARLIADILGREWIYRGQHSSWPLTTSLERRIARLMWLKHIDHDAIERASLSRFKKRAHHYATEIPASYQSEADLEWLALLRHHGGPTRFLDVTQSFYVAAFFALDAVRPHAVNDSADAAIWAIRLSQLDAWGRGLDQIGLDDQQREEIERSVAYRWAHVMEERHRKVVSKFFGPDPDGQLPEIVLNFEPLRLNERLAAQQGIFLCPSNLKHSFLYNLANTYDRKSDELHRIEHDHVMSEDKNLINRNWHKYGIIKVLLAGKEVRRRALQDLGQMDINSATLFPGLDGFARSV
jgi:hypothetical protein